MDTASVTHERKHYDLLDLVRLILSFFVVMIHTQFLGQYSYPWTRIAVPLFFIFSSYFFFKKVNARHRRSSKKSELYSFILRNVKLYLFWFVLLSPIILVQRRDYFLGQGLIGVINLILNFFVGSTFTASWFISALVIGMVIVFFASRKLNNVALVIIFGVVYALVTLRSAYMPFFSDFHLGLKIAEYYEMILNSPVNTFPASLFWLSVGKLFADGFKIKLKPSVIIACISAVLLFAEWFFISKITTPSVYNADYYFMLAPLCIAIFSILIHFDGISFKFAPVFRKMSVIIFASHGSILYCINGLFHHINVSLPSILIFVIISALCIGLSLLIIWLEKFKYFKWLKYSH